MSIEKQNEINLQRWQPRTWAERLPGYLGLAVYYLLLPLLWLWWRLEERRTIRRLRNYLERCWEKSE